MERYTAIRTKVYDKRAGLVIFDFNAMAVLRPKDPVQAAINRAAQLNEQEAQRGA